ncbi:hypothetical protein IQ224_06525 [Microcystis sp. LEGE 00066]|uniref:Similarity n=2 Tax=Microcystis aeruginosa (strain PCC 7806) TaxID=267872 RepID=A8YK45_MICA7|nr:MULTISPECIES: hypothetical protein [Microcystis]TRT97405.1 MAG: hypothetical protein EWV61_18940 [Microcystis aeruginosa Ma_AC_P_19900807_S300]ARI80526.1 hypothetical protein BH695_1245 [Microcystis aeruginosa PCC 7806SL]ELS47688.1 hypothetical protein C789_2499 [Microcystis aeruginosa FACHB-905 = DIANCHI905]MBE9261879.1 hypothetical protein [Microcystis sp. LEGE 00066]UGS07982.1 hypothetical protein LRR78_17400 [Microcystis aeruginosa FACHB-905 = DIANCHI905]
MSKSQPTACQSQKVINNCDNLALTPNFCDRVLEIAPLPLNPFIGTVIPLEEVGQSLCDQ